MSAQSLPGAGAVKDDLLEMVSARLATSGLVVRGGFNFEVGDAAPPGLFETPARSLLLVGQVGVGVWSHFQRWRDTQLPTLADPLDAWSREIIGGVAAQIGARAVSPNDKPYMPFQQWAMRAQGLKPSPLGILMDPQYGLWHAYRGALLFDHEITVAAHDKTIHLCDTCVGKPCLKPCPVGAYSNAGFAYQSCLSHVRGTSGEPCRSTGCLDRNACPFGTEYRYPADMQAFHMASFAR